MPRRRAKDIRRKELRRNENETHDDSDYDDGAIDDTSQACSPNDLGRFSRRRGKDRVKEWSNLTRLEFNRKLEEWYNA